MDIKRDWEEPRKASIKKLVSECIDFAKEERENFDKLVNDLKALPIAMTARDLEDLEDLEDGNDGSGDNFKPPK